ncbi:MAG: Cof-type HAD-IIB family hydrolase [Erysipelotrichaceae bacterium]
MTIKLIAMDMDGTLLNHEDHITKDTLDALMKAQEKGIILALASGRSYGRLMDYADLLKLSEYNGFLIEVNGMAIYDLNKKQRTVFKRLERQDLKDLSEFLEPKEVECQYVVDRGIFDYIPHRVRLLKEAYRKKNNIPDDFPWTAGTFKEMVDTRGGYPDLRYIKGINEIDCEINKICVVDQDADRINQIYLDLCEHFKDRFWFGCTAPRWLECMPQGINKGTALHKLCLKLAIQPDEVLCFGDGENDIDMLNAVTYGIAMDNAMDSVKEIAYDICASNNEDGIAKALKKYKVID